MNSLVLQCNIKFCVEFGRDMEPQHNSACIAYVCV
ncbi:hypothetical protein YYU_04785 [Anaplasma phagocytophilum str. HZ2]|uniref:Uncharacterized protein n=1 Tax=Anaplasma phagocytophilum (strain HZ) TaxID=212042 RepID=Q2GJ53_ANAPZ|nr:hypothetical protein APH_1041 [Anaplasma phagocytophilum str. HZ]AGR79610.1 hypothetical protein YYU_04785 [Anaplasma phagocytophilum str. HZ2]AGR80865.1 hypothetical protein WSQ_04815 [Anaplasma phagocytophilum str. JM]AGR82120.1 hypothetical protein YYY_04820 [Anaplasma phagocytophilum str. Dog2]